MYVTNWINTTWIYKNVLLFYIAISHNRLLQPQRRRSGLERSPRQRKFGCSSPCRDRPKSQKAGSDSSTAKRSALGVSSRIHGDDDYIIFRGKRAWPSIRLNLNFLYPRKSFTKIVWNWPCGSWEEDFLNSAMKYCYFVIISPIGKRRGTSFEQTWIYFTHWCIVPSFGEIGPLVLAK